PRDRLAGKADGAFRHRIEVAGELEALEIREEAVVKELRVGKRVELGGAEPQAGQVVDELRETRGDQEVSSRRQSPEEELEDGLLMHAAVEIRLQHRELIEVREQRARGPIGVRRAHVTTLGTRQRTSEDSTSRMPRRTSASRRAPSPDGSTDRVRSQTIVVSKPRSRASSAVHRTQKSRARPQTNTSSIPRSRR